MGRDTARWLVVLSLVGAIVAAVAVVVADTVRARDRSLSGRLRRACRSEWDSTAGRLSAGSASVFVAAVGMPAAIGTTYVDRIGHL